MNTLLSDALKANESSYLKILKIHLLQDSFEIIRSQAIDLGVEHGFREKLSEWFKAFAHEGHIYFEDLEAFLLRTNLETLHEHFKKGEKEFGFAYRRIVNDKIRWANMKFIPTPDYTNEHPTLYLYVIDLDDAIVDYQKRTKLLEERLKEKEAENKLLSSFSTVFLSTHVINLDENSVREHVTYPRAREYVTNTNGAKEQMATAISNLVAPEYVESTLKFTDLSTLQERMGSRRMISHEFVGRNLGWIRAYFIAVDLNEKGHWKHVIFATRVIDEEKRHEQKLISLTNTDELTHLYNRHAYTEFTQELQLNALIPNLSVLSFDINGLKKANDTLGHDAGDELICTAAQLMDEIFSSKGRCFRTGGDEFIAILNATQEELAELLNQFNQSVAHWKGQKNGRLSVSVGVASLWGYPTSSLHELEKLADQNMYKTKQKYYQSQGNDRRRSDRRRS